MTETRTVATLRKNNAEEIRVSLVDHGGYALVDLRIFSPTGRSEGEPRPTRSGICLPRNRLRALIEALQCAERDAFR